MAQYVIKILLCQLFQNNSSPFQNQNMPFMMNQMQNMGPAGMRMAMGPRGMGPGGPVRGGQGFQQIPPSGPMMRQQQGAPMGERMRFPMGQMGPMGPGNMPPGAKQVPMATASPNSQGMWHGPNGPSMPNHVPMGPGSGSPVLAGSPHAQMQAGSPRPGKRRSHCYAEVHFIRIISLLPQEIQPFIGIVT